MITSVTRSFPASWRFSVAVERSPGRDEYGVPLPAVEHEVSDCMVSTTASEDQARSDHPDTTAWLYAPVGADFKATDTVVIPASPLWVHGRFVVTGRPSPTPLGMSVPLKEVGSG